MHKIQTFKLTLFCNLEFTNDEYFINFLYLSYFKYSREGSVIADVVLIVLAAIQDPFRILEMSVSTGKLGKLRVDSSYFLKGRGENGKAYKFYVIFLNQMIYYFANRNLIKSCVT